MHRFCYAMKHQKVITERGSHAAQSLIKFFNEQVDEMHGHQLH